MQQSTNREESNILELPNLYPRPIWVRLVIIFGLTLLYIATFFFLGKVNIVSVALIVIPVAMAGWYFGINTGLIASFLGVALSAFLLTDLIGRNWFTWIAIDWPGNLLVIGVGYLTGRLHREYFVHTSTLDELRLRDRSITLINMTIQDLLAPQNLNDRYHYLVSHLVNLFVADYAYFVRWDAAREQAIFTATTVYSEKLTSNIVLGPDESELTKSVLSTGSVQVIEDVPNSHYVIIPTLFENLSLSPRSALCIPLMVRLQKLGAAIIVYDTPHHFSAKELTYAEFASDQFALALWTIQQEFEIQRQLKVANTLISIERTLSETERVGLRTVLQLIVDSASELIPGVENVVLHLLDNDQQILVPRAVAGHFSESKAPLNMHLGEGIAGEVISTGKVIAVSDTKIDPRFLKLDKPMEFRSLIVAPIQRNQRCIGTISIQSDEPRAFTPEDSQLLDALGIEAAIAIENARLIEATRQDLKEINALYHISRELATALDPDQLMQNVVNLLKQDFDYYHVQIFVVDAKSGDLLARKGSGKIGDQLFEQGYRLRAGAGIVGHVAATKLPFVTNNVNNVIFFIRDALLSETKSELAVPIKTEKEVVGVLDICHDQPGHLTERDMQLVTAVADQLAVALQQARLYTELQTSLTQEKAIRSQLIQSERLAVVGRLLASVSHELNNPLQAIQNALFLVKDEEKLSSQGYQDLEIILSETERMSVLLERLHTAFRPTRTEDFQDVELNRMVESVIALTTTHMRHNEISLTFLPDPKLPVVPAIPDQIRQVILNLFLNAEEAMPSGGNLSIETQFMVNEEQVLLSVSDTGRGLDSKVLPHIFEPFFTNKESGTGLGLTICFDIIRQHGGSITAENNPQGGATFKVRLPIHNAK